MKPNESESAGPEARMGAGDAPRSLSPDRWTGFMLLCSLRYCMGRQSYAVSVCCDFLREHWQEIDAKTRATMRRDLDEELRRYAELGQPMGADFDETAWRRLLTFMDSHRTTPAPSAPTPEVQP